ncbi:MAG TPA: preprotein translocase subunit SecE [Clostridia bacterium]|jgi:preprotein translocase SecE subunit|nr:preprotein translocase subunit SecE [Clostridia bacterium]
MAQNLSTPKKDAKSADKKIVKIDAHGHSHKKPFWSQLGPKLLLPASILLAAGGLFLAVYNTMQILTPSEGYTLSTGLKIASGLLGLLMAIAGILGLFVKKGKTLMTLGALSLVYALVILTASAKMGTMALVCGIAAVVITLFYVLAVDGKHEVGLFRFLREMIGEVKKLTWLSGKELFSHTLAVVVFVLAMALLIGLLDLAFSSGFGALSSIKIG